MDPLLIGRSLMVIHFVFLAFVVLGGFLVLWRGRWAWLHVPSALWGVAITTFGWTCPLTPLENHYRAQAGLGMYEGGFIDHYLFTAIYPPGLTRELQLALAVGLGLLLLAQYAGAWYRRRPRGAGIGAAG